MSLRQPHMQRYQSCLRAEAQQREDECGARPEMRERCVAHGIEGELPTAALQHAETEQDADRAYMGHQEIQESGAANLGNAVLRGDEEVGAERHRLPRDHEEVRVVGEDDHGHAGEEDVILQSHQAGGCAFAGYFRAGEGTSPGLMGLQYHVFLASMAVVILADDAYLFMVAWETMALSSYFLVTSQHRIPEIRRAGFLYLIMAHVGAICILLSFGVLQGGSWQFTFDAMRHASLTPLLATTAFLLALLGFGAKAGLVPLHVWLPEAHPAAPSPVSAMMSGLMLKTAVYGMLRISFDLLHVRFWQWGVLVLALGLFSAIYGAAFAAVQSDMKRLLAYSSIENIGIIFTGIGLSLLFETCNLHLFAALALCAALVHSLNHALFKSLLFLTTGSVLHATGQRNLGKLGGLIRRMPWVASVALIGTLAIAGLPPLNGFVSEWLLLQAFLFTPQIPHAFVNMFIPLGAAVLALTAALAAYVMVKFYGVVFLGQPREAALAEAHDANWLERLGLVWPGA